MIDLHTHLLPDIDDGARNLAEAMRMTDVLYEQKVHYAICTPHFDAFDLSLSDFLAKRATSIASMCNSRIHLIAASETTLNNYLFHYPDLSELCVENTRYLLIELPFDRKWDAKVYDMLHKLIDYYSITPVIAHIERYPAVKRRMNYICRLIDLGCVIQLNTSSVLDRKLRKRALRYIKKGYVDVLGSDCHNMMSRPPVFIEAVDYIRLTLGVSYCNTLEYNAGCIMKGIAIRKKEAGKLF